MPTLRIEHPIRDFAGWKNAFDRDPAGRQCSGVRHYQVFRPIDDPHFITIDLDFARASEAEAFLVAMRKR